MAFSGDPTNVNVHSGGTGKNSYPIADQFIPEFGHRLFWMCFNKK